VKIHPHFSHSPDFHTFRGAWMQTDSRSLVPVSVDFKSPKFVQLQKIDDDFHFK